MKYAFNQRLLKGPSKKLNARVESGLCDACIRAKSTRYRFGKRKSYGMAKGSDSDDEVETKEESVTVPVMMRRDLDVKTVIERLCTDTKGPLSTPTRSGHVHYQWFIDDSTKFIWVYTMKTKDIALDNLKDLMEVQLAKV